MALTSTKQNLAVQLDRRLIEQARRVAAERHPSVSTLIAERIESLAGPRRGWRPGSIRGRFARSLGRNCIREKLR